jgi:hypothetical protein
MRRQVDAWVVVSRYAVALIYWSRDMYYPSLTDIEGLIFSLTIGEHS